MVKSQLAGQYKGNDHWSNSSAFKNRSITTANKLATNEFTHISKLTSCSVSLGTVGWHHRWHLATKDRFLTTFWFSILSLSCKIIQTSLFLFTPILCCQKWNDRYHAQPFQLSFSMSFYKTAYLIFKILSSCSPQIINKKRQILRMKDNDRVENEVFQQRSLLWSTVRSQVKSFQSWFNKNLWYRNV